MSTVHVVFASVDETFVRAELLPCLLFEGWTHWSSSVQPDRPTATDARRRVLIRRSDAVIVIVSPALFGSADALSDWGTALSLRGPATVVAVLRAPFCIHDVPGEPLNWPGGLPIAWTADGAQQARRLLRDRLPDTTRPRPSGGRVSGQAIDWSESAFTAALSDAAARHDHARMAELVGQLAGHLKRRSGTYPISPARADLTTLRQERAFDLLCTAAQALVASGVRDARVRRLGAQGLIETRRYARALTELNSIAADPAAPRGEVFEAQGLIGRTFKQRYVDDAVRGARPNVAWLRQAIEAYDGVYRLDRSQYWHGVNAASCIRRGLSDGLAEQVPDDAEQRALVIAEQVTADLAQLAQAAPLAVWDAASRVEALVLLGRFEEAREALEVYVEHPDMHAFEVSSTLRQFDQVLQLGRHGAGAAILDRLRGVVQRYRAGTLAAADIQPAARAGAAPEESAQSAVENALNLVIRVGSPAWLPGAVPDLTLQSRLGTVVTARGTARSVTALLADPGVISIEESRPVGSASECERSMPFIRAIGEYPAVGGAFREAGDHALIAVIDDGIDVLHEAFLDGDGKSRIVGIWDQRTDGRPPDGFGYGHFHDAAAIAGYIADGKVPTGLGRNVRGHGTHVASIAAGRAAGDFAGGVAPQALLLVVISGGAGPIGYSTTHIEALAFFDRVATQLGLPVVVNLSQGMNAGAHDGRSALEVAFDAFSQAGRLPGRVVVKSAGNERNKDGHAKVTLPAGSIETLTWQRNPQAARTERLELWWRADSDIRFRLGDPGNTWSDWTDRAAPERAGVLGASGPYRLKFIKRHVDNGDSLLSIELGDVGSPAANGQWKLEMHCRTAPADALLHAWIERADARFVPSRFIGFDDPEMTLSIPATAASVIAVGAVEAGDPLRVGSFSSYGPTRDGRECPTVCAPGVGVRAACGGTSDGVFSDDGTSMAAPHVSGAIALALSRARRNDRSLTGSQIAAALRQNTRSYNGKWDRGQGWGLLDVTRFLEACEP